MAAKIELLRPGKAQQPACWATYDIPWYFPLEDLETGENRLLIVSCTPEKLVAGYFKTEPFESFPLFGTSYDVLEYCSDKTRIDLASPDKPLLTQEFNDAEIGLVSFVVTHAVDGPPQQTAWPKEIPRVLSVSEAYDAQLVDMPAQISATLL